MRRLLFNLVSIAIGNMGSKCFLILLLIVSVLIPANKLKADGPAVQWEKTFGGSSGDNGSSVQQTSDGGYIIVGGHYGGYYYDVYLVKTDNGGNEQWHKMFGASQDEDGYSVQQTSDGGYIIAGVTSSFGAGQADVYLIKTNSSGDKQWQKTYGWSYWDEGHSVQQTSDGGYIIAGNAKPYEWGPYYVYLIKTNSSGDKQWQKIFGGDKGDQGYSVQQTSDGGYIIAGSTNSYGSGNSDVYLIKTNSSGDMLWQKTFGGSNSDYGYSVQQTSDSGYIIAGNTKSYGAGNYDVYLVKTNSSGDLQWQKTFGGIDNDYGRLIQRTSDGGYVVTGYTKSYGMGKNDVYLIKTNSSGNMQWQKTIGGGNDDYSFSVQQTSDGGYIIAGYTKSYGDIDGDVYLIKLAAENTTGAGTINGTVRDGNTSSPIADAEVFVTGMPNLYDKSDISGHYEITGVPYNTLFTLVASAADYNTAYINNVQVTETNPIQTVDVNLVPAPYTSLRLIELNPNPNSDPMVIMQGGIGHRYYQIVDECNKPRSPISVTTSPNLGGPFFSSGTKGVVSIDVNSLEVTNGQTITVTHLGGVALTPAEQKSFVVNIEPLEQEKIWELQSKADLGISNVQLETEVGTEIRLLDEQGSDSVPEVTSVCRKAILGGGLSASVEIAAYCRINDFDYGPRIGGGVSLTCGKEVRDKFIYAYDTADLPENIAKLYTMLFSPPNTLSPVLEIIERGLESPLIAEYQDTLEAGIYLKEGGWIKGNLATLGFASMLGLDCVRSEFGLDAKCTGFLIFNKNGTIAVAIELSGDYEQEAGYGRNGLPWSMLPSTLKPFNGIESESLCLLRFEAGFSSTGTLCEIKIAERRGNPTFNGPYNINEEVWTVTGPSDKLLKAVPSIGILYLLIHSIEASETPLIDLSPATIREELEDFFAKAQNDAGLIIRYKKNLLPSQIISKSEFELDIGFSGLLKCSIGVGGENRTVETKELLIETGRVIGTNRYPAESYKEADYIPIDITLGDVYVKTLLDVGTPVLQSILYYAEHPVEAGQEINLIARNSILHIGADVLEAGQMITNIFEAQYLPKMQVNMMNTKANVMADSNGSSEIKYFGFGGTYQLEPTDLNLPSPGTFSITYSDEEITGHSEALLRMYRWSDANSRWEYVGSTVDEVNNTVTASINKFGTYAVGAQVEYGNFTFHPEPNAAPSDGNSIVTFTSEIIRNNDGTQVADGVLFTIAASGGTITTADANTLLDGVQIVTNSGILQFTLKAPQVGVKVKTEAASLNRLAVVTGDANFVDSNAPQPPTGLQVQIVEGKILLSWNESNEIDLAGYKIYFDDDANGPPYNGAAYYSGSNSPVDVADANSHFLRGLRSGHTYYITVTAYDMSGNESGYGNEIVFVNTLPEDSDSDGMPDTWEIAYSNTANGLDPTIDDAMADNDGDGVTNLKEYLTGHNPLVPDVDGDFNHDRSVNILDLAVFCSHWLEQDCNDQNWCEGADLNHSNTVNFVDFAFFAKNWSPQAPAVLIQDFDYDGDVDFGDLAVFADQWLLEKLSADVAPGEGDGIVNFLDFAVFADSWQGDMNQLFQFASQWLQPSAYSADIAPFPLDGIVNFLDFAVLANHWLEGD